LYQYENVNFGSIFVATFFRTTKITFGVYIIPIVISILVQQNNFKNKQFIKAKELSKKLEKEISYLKCLKLEQDENILLKSDNKIVELQVKIMNIMFIKSEGNYVEVHYINNGNITKKLIRDRIKNIENILPSHTFIRCHNRYIINKYFVTKVNGNARGLSLELKDYNEIISVSRSKIKAFESFMTKRYRLHSHS
jgi:DNA-binding LytR/AlgR family response regulator